MIDIHCHLLYDVDDGAKTLDESVEMLKRAKSQKIDRIILTPHLRHGMFRYDKAKIDSGFATLQPIAKEMGIDIRIGTEYHVDSGIIEAFKSGQCHTLADSAYVLAEYSHNSEFSFIYKMTQELILAGYIPVIAHVERYECLAENINNIEQIREAGALIQTNADAILGLEGRTTKKNCKKLLKNNLVDIVASDSHGIKNRICNLQKCHQYVEKKYSKEYAGALFERNPSKIFEIGT